MKERLKHPRRRPRALMLLSGGLDSTVALALSLKKFNVTHSVYFNYGQKALDQERKSCKKLTKRLGVRFVELHLPWPCSSSGCALTSKRVKVPLLQKADLRNRKKLEKAASRVMVYNRNMIFISCAARLAAEMGCRFLIAGFNAEEAATFPDNSKAFLDSINRTLKISLRPFKLRVISPTLLLTKEEIVRLSVKKKIPLDTVYSCYRGKRLMCGQCESCMRLRRAIEACGASEKANLRMKK
ncbi:MAG: 7-cyano-7-deazaguanine synthase [Candidatus Aureabacteria bacterium]|nr:7-cyano-7-deazaguanine synthase [Candidatus Auribacterota bacterium]